jgi:hypothetical protein
MTSSQHVYEVRPRKDHRGVDLISDALPIGRLWHGEPNAASNATRAVVSAVLSGFLLQWQSICAEDSARYSCGFAFDYAKFFSRSYRALIRVYDAAGNLIETHEHAGGFKEPCMQSGWHSSKRTSAKPPA